MENTVKCKMAMMENKAMKSAEGPHQISRDNYQINLIELQLNIQLKFVVVWDPLSFWPFLIKIKYQYLLRDNYLDMSIVSVLHEWQCTLFGCITIFADIKVKFS